MTTYTYDVSKSDVHKEINQLIPWLISDLNMIIVEYTWSHRPKESTIPPSFATKIHDFLGRNYYGTELLLSDWNINDTTSTAEFDPILELKSSIPFLTRTNLDRDYMRSNDLVGRVGMTWWIPSGDLGDKFVIVWVHPCLNVIGVIFPQFTLAADADGVLSVCNRRSDSIASQITTSSSIKMDMSMFDVLWPVHYISLQRPWQYLEWHVWLGGDLQTPQNDQGNVLGDLTETDDHLSVAHKPEKFLSVAQLDQIDREFWKC